MTAFELKSSLAQTKEWDAQELRSLEREGILKKCTKDTDHIALHPYWLSNPIQGIHEELDHRLGKWVQRCRLSSLLPTTSFWPNSNSYRRFNGYLVTYKKIRRNSKTPAMINVDQPWVHVDVKGKFYIYQPAVDQVLRGKTLLRILFSLIQKLDCIAYCRDCYQAWNQSCCLCRTKSLQCYSASRPKYPCNVNITHILYQVPILP